MSKNSRQKSLRSSQAEPNISIQTAMSRLFSKNFQRRQTFFLMLCSTISSLCKKRPSRGRHRTVSVPSISCRHSNIILHPNLVKPKPTSPRPSSPTLDRPRRGRNNQPHNTLRSLARRLLHHNTHSKPPLLSPLTGCFACHRPVLIRL